MRLLLAILSLSATTALADPLDDPSTVAGGNWSLTPVGDDEGFSHCTLAAKTADGDILAFHVRPDRSVVISLGNKAWKLTVGERHPVDWQVDSGPVFRGTAEARDTTLVSIPVAEDAEFLTELRRGQVIRFKTRGQPLGYRLDGMTDALPEVANCLDEWKRREAETIRRNPFLSLAVAPGGSEDGPVTRARSFVTALASLPAFTDIQVVAFKGEEAMPQSLSAYHGAWYGNETVGAVRITAVGTDSLEDDVATILAHHARECEGAYAGGTVGRPVASIPLRRVFTICDQDGSKHRANYILLRSDAVSVMVMQMGADKAEQRVVEWDDALADLATVSIKGKSP